MSNRTKAGGLAARFAHLAGFRRAAAKPRADEAPATTDEVEEVEEEVEELEERVDDLEDEVESEGGGEDEAPEASEEPDPKTKPAESSAYRNGRKAGAAAERKRCAAIFGAPEAGLNQPLAASLAFDSDLPVKQALAILKSGTAGAAAPAAPAKAGLDNRMRGAKRIDIGSEGPAPDRNTAAGNAAFILGAGRAPARS